MQHKIVTPKTSIHCIGRRLDGTGYTHTFDTDYIQKMIKKHIEFNPERFALLTEILSDFTEVEDGLKDSRENDLFAVINTLDKRCREVDMCVENKGKRLYMRSLYYKNISDDQNGGNKIAPPECEATRSGDEMPTETQRPSSNAPNEPDFNINNTTENDVVNNLSEEFTRYLQGELTGIDRYEINFFEEQKKNIEDQVKQEQSTVLSYQFTQLTRERSSVAVGDLFEAFASGTN